MFSFFSSFHWRLHFVDFIIIRSTFLSDHIVRKIKDRISLLILSILIHRTLFLCIYQTPFISFTSDCISSTSLSSNQLSFPLTESAESRFGDARTRRVNTVVSIRSNSTLYKPSIRFTCSGASLTFPITAPENIGFSQRKPDPGMKLGRFFVGCDYSYPPVVFCSPFHALVVGSISSFSFFSLHSSSCLYSPEFYLSLFSFSS